MFSPSACPNSCHMIQVVRSLEGLVDHILSAFITTNLPSNSSAVLPDSFEASVRFALASFDFMYKPPPPSGQFAARARFTSLKSLPYVPAMKSRIHFRYFSYSFV